MTDPLIDDINETINEEIARISDQVSSGNITSFDEYKKRTGVIIGLKMALEMIATSSKNYLHDKDEES